MWGKILASLDPLVPYSALQVIKWLLAVLDLCLSVTLGYTLTYGSQAEIRKAKRENLSAQVVKIHWRSIHCPLVPIDLSCFLYTHEKYVDTSFIRNHRNVYLAGITATEAFFVVTENADLYNIATFPFTFLGYFFASTKLVIVSHGTLHNLGREIGDPKLPVTLIQITARSGSTLLAQALNSVPGTRVLSEPWCFHWLNYYYRKGHLFRSEHDDLLRNGMRILCKTEPGTNYERLAFKTGYSICGQIEILHDMFPSFNLIYSSRNVKNSLKSLIKVLELNISPTITGRCGVPRLWVTGSGLFPLDDPKYEKMLAKYQTVFMNSSYEEMFAVYFVVGQYITYMKAKDIYKGVILFEDIEDNPKEAFRKLLQFAEIPESYLEGTLKVADKDSQNGIFAPRGYTKEFLSPKNLIQADLALREFGTPLSIDMTLDEFKKALDLK